MKSPMITYLEKKSQIDVYKKLGISEVIICSSRISRLSKQSITESLELAKLCKENKITPILEWDILMTQKEFKSTCELIDSLDLSSISIMRLRDPGAVEYIFKNYPNIKIQLLLEYGNHNLLGICEWVKYLATSIERVILSIEISKANLEEYIKKIPTRVEVMGIGRIPLFYSPRALISHSLNETSDNETWHEFKANSEESPHRGFDVIENIHGTLMYNTKDYGPLAHLGELIKMNVSKVRIDFRHIEDEQLKEKLLEISHQLFIANNEDDLNKYIELFKINYQRPLIKGFYKINKSDVLFKKLKNSRTKRYDQSYLGEVVEVNKGIHIGISIKNSGIDSGDILKLCTPDGKEKIVEIKNMTNSRLENISRAKVSELVFIKHIGGISVKTQVYKVEESEL